MWENGVIDGYYYEIKSYENGSQYGIDGGRISKLYITRDGEEVACYDRGWDFYPKTKAAGKIVAKLMQIFN